MGRVGYVWAKAATELRMAAFSADADPNGLTDRLPICISATPRESARAENLRQTPHVRLIFHVKDQLRDVGLLLR